MTLKLLKPVYTFIFVSNSGKIHFPGIYLKEMIYKRQKHIYAKTIHLNVYNKKKLDKWFNMDEST